MEKKNWKIFFAIIFFVGMILIYFSVNLGVAMAETYLCRWDSLDTGVYEIVVNNSIHAVQIIGTLISAGSGIGILKLLFMTIESS